MYLLNNNKLLMGFIKIYVNIYRYLTKFNNYLAVIQCVKVSFSRPVFSRGFYHMINTNVTLRLRDGGHIS